MVESELFPALRYFGLRFYAYNPVSAQLSFLSLLKQQTIILQYMSVVSVQSHSQSSLIPSAPVSFPVLQFLIACIL